MLNMSSDDRVLRKNSFFGLMNTYHHYRNTLAATLTGTCRSRYFYARVRGYQNSMEASLAEENIPVSLYNGLIQTIHANLKPLHEYITMMNSTPMTCMCLYPRKEKKVFPVHLPKPVKQ